ncbi:MAG: thioredoxin domain-containing protein [Methylobacteriaceae bacterium]|nr:thioredoxin domain-containing protein [Methylobacteriaceae bacterium]
MHQNRLAGATSPYLLQHAANPVDWRQWSAEALAEAKAAGKPILLSVGYAACHWCHVMAHESFEDEATAAVMNELFVNIKVDREERPDIDHIYMSALHALGQQGGWPLTMFLTPDAEPFWGGTYFPKTARYGHPAFTDVLRSVARVFHAEPDKVRQNATALRQALTRESVKAGDQIYARAFLDDFASRAAGIIDQTHGGIRGAPKFPNPSILELLWRASLRTGDNQTGALVTLTLDRMSEGGIYDHLGGGYSRYSTDERWLVPHFEKMLYDNAQILELLAAAYAETKRPLFAQRARETVAWLDREMTTAEGAFCASLDADSEGVEGKFYVWHADEIERILGADNAAFFARFYDVTPEGNWHHEQTGDHVTILNRLNAPEASEEDEQRLTALRAMLFAAREKRPRPGLDDKVLADWNGLMIAALARSALIFERPEWLNKAARAYAFIRDIMRDPSSETGAKLAHSWRNGTMVVPGFALDHAAMARAALALHEVRAHLASEHQAIDFLDDAKRWIETLESDYRDAESGLISINSRAANDVLTRLAPTADDAIPNAHSVHLDNLIRLVSHTGDCRWLDKADALFESLRGVVFKTPLAHCGVLNAFDLRENGIEIVVAGSHADALHSAALLTSYIGRTVTDAREAALPDTHIAAVQAAAADRAMALVCTHAHCLPPAYAPADLLDRVREARSPVNSGA